MLLHVLIGTLTGHGGLGVAVDGKWLQYGVVIVMHVHRLIEHVDGVVLVVVCGRVATTASSTAGAGASTAAAVLRRGVLRGGGAGRRRHRVDDLGKAVEGVERGQRRERREVLRGEGRGRVVVVRVGGGGGVRVRGVLRLQSGLRLRSGDHSLLLLLLSMKCVECMEGWR